MDNHSHHNTALYYIWENNCSSPSACFFDLQKGDICVLGRNDGYKVIYIDKPINSSALWNDFHVIDSLTEYNLNLPKEHEILCMTGSDKAEGNEIVLRRLIDCCKNEWIKDFFVETKSVLSGITEFWNLRQLMRLTGDYGLMYIPVAKVPSKEIKVVSSGNSLYYIPEVDSLGEELVSKNVESGDFCICRKGNGLVFFEVNHKPVSTDNLYSFPEIETVGETDIMFPLVFLQLCKNGVKKEKNTKFINRFKSAFHNRKSLEILDLTLKIVQGENVSLPHVNCAASIHNDVPEYENFVVEKVPYYEQNTVPQESEGVEKCTLAFKNLPEDVQLDIEIEFLKCIREQSDTRNRFRSKFSSVASFYSFVQNAKEQKCNLPDDITSVYIELLKRIVNTLEGNSCEKNIVKVFTDAIEELQKVEIKEQCNLSPLPPAKEDRKGGRWTKEEEQLVTMYFKGGYSPKDIAHAVGRSEVSIYMRLDKLGLVQYSYGDNIAEINSDLDVEKEKSKNDEEGLYVENLYGSSTLYSKDRERLFTATGKLKIINNKVYRFNFKDICFTVKRIEKKGNCWTKSSKLLVAFDNSDLYSSINPHNFIDEIEDFDDCDDIIENRLKYRGKWYDFDGEEIVEDSMISTELAPTEEIGETTNENSYDEIEIEHVYIDSKGRIINKEIVCEKQKFDIPDSGAETMNFDGGDDRLIEDDEPVIDNFIDYYLETDYESTDAYKAAMRDMEESIAYNPVKNLLLPKDSPVSFTADSIKPKSQMNNEFIPKGKLAKIDLFAKNQYDVLWLMSLIDICWKERLSEEFTLEQIACMEIANLWELQNTDKTLDADEDFEDCKEFLSTEISVNEEMRNFDIYKAIKNYPICGAFEDFVDILTENSHLNILKAWINESDETILINESSVFTNACLFSVTKQKYETKIKLNPSWRYYLINNMRDLKKFCIKLFYKFY